MQQWHKILCAVDFSEASYAGLERAVALAREGDAELCIMYVEPAPTDGVDRHRGEPDCRRPAVRSAEAVKNLCLIMNGRVPDSVRMRPILKHGDVGAQIVRTAREEEIDVIVLTSSGADNCQPDRIGTVANYVVQAATCPVVVLNPPRQHSVGAVSGAAVTGAAATGAAVSGAAATGAVHGYHAGLNHLAVN